MSAVTSKTSDKTTKRMQKIKTGIFFNGQNYEPCWVVLSRENAVELKLLATFEDRAGPFPCVPIFHEHKHLILSLLIQLIKKAKNIHDQAHLRTCGFIISTLVLLRKQFEFASTV